MEIDLNHWWYWDNNHSALIEDSYTDLSLLSQKRWSRFMGYEVNLSMKKNLAWKWSWGLEGGVFFPGDYFSISLPGDEAQGNTPAIVCKFFTEIKL